MSGQQQSLLVPIMVIPLFCRLSKHTAVSESVHQHDYSRSRVVMIARRFGITGKILLRAASLRYA
ncbi:hypothetical protein [Acidihalobacter ferrooxydans]|uniref:hypothetical protein n=1 Tax=Acidihalobacter ferrooxydans TaxID=1765967 RepID=UPI0012EC6C76|nr:hypothetical protein [Acidihalobacter ferrooxydans]